MRLFHFTICFFGCAFFLSGCSSTSTAESTTSAARVREDENAAAIKIIAYDTVIRKVGVNRAQAITIEFLSGSSKGTQFTLYIFPLKNGTALEGKQFYLRVPLSLLTQNESGTWGFEMIMREAPTKAINPESVRTVTIAEMEALLGTK